MTPGEKNRDTLIVRLGDGCDADARLLERALRAPPREAKVALRGLLRDLRDKARELRWIGSGTVEPPRPRHCDLVGLVRDAAAPWQPRLKRRGTALGIEASPARIVGDWDRAHVETVLGELLSNACLHGAGRPVTVRVSRDDARTVTLVVEDAGEGPIPHGPYRRFDRGPSAKGRGMGLGLWLVDAVARRNGGRLRFSRGARGGTRATVRLASR